MGLPDRLPRAAKACPKCDTRADISPGAAFLAVLLRQFAAQGAILQRATPQHGLVKPMRNHASIPAAQDSILTGSAPMPWQHHRRFKLSLQHKAILYVRGQGKTGIQICARMQRHAWKRMVEPMGASDSRAGFAVAPVDLRRTTEARAAFAMHAAANGTISEYPFFTMVYVGILRRSACYLCNTHRKTG